MESLCEQEAILLYLQYFHNKSGSSCQDVLLSKEAFVTALQTAGSRDMVCELMA